MSLDDKLEKILDLHYNLRKIERDDNMSFFRHLSFEDKMKLVNKLYNAFNTHFGFNDSTIEEMVKMIIRNNQQCVEKHINWTVDNFCNIPNEQLVKELSWIITPFDYEEYDRNHIWMIW